jgi:ribosomal protein S18 acetylase RimI-like enzyme
MFGMSKEAPDPSIQRTSYRLALPDDTEACLVMRGLTRENAISVDGLAAMGITATSWADEMRSGLLSGHVCLDDDGAVVGYCFGENRSGEVVVLALLPSYEQRGVGRHLLGLVVDHLRAKGHKRLFLGCSADPASRSYGFYRHLGWVSTGTFDTRDDEVLELLLAAKAET